MMLVIFAGLPGVGKSTIAKVLAARLGATYLRIDTIEQMLREGGVQEIGGLGYGVAQRLALDNLRLGHPVVIDSVNPWELTREAYRDVARSAGQPFLDVEVVCSDPTLHRQRVETRESEVNGLTLPTWEEVTSRDYHAWSERPLQVDSAILSPAEAVERVLEALATTR